MRQAIITLFVVAMTLSAALPGIPGDVFTPLTCLAFTPRTIAFPGTDGRTHIVYELLLTNTNVTPATVETVEVVEAANPSNTLDTYDAKKLLTALAHHGKLRRRNAGDRIQRHTPLDDQSRFQSRRNDSQEIAAPHQISRRDLAVSETRYAGRS